MPYTSENWKYVMGWILFLYRSQSKFIWIHNTRSFNTIS